MKSPQTSKDVLAILITGQVPVYISEEFLLLSLTVDGQEIDVAPQKISKKSWKQSELGIENTEDMLFPVSHTRHMVNGMNIKTESNQILYPSTFKEPREINTHTQLFFPAGSIIISEE